MTGIRDSYDLAPLGEGELRRWTRTAARLSGAKRAKYAPSEWSRLAPLNLQSFKAFMLLQLGVFAIPLYMAIQRGVGFPVPFPALTPARFAIAWLNPQLVLLGYAAFSLAVWSLVAAPRYLHMARRFEAGELVVDDWAAPTTSLKPGWRIILLEEAQVFGWEDQISRENDPYLVEVLSVEHSEDGAVTVQLPEGHWRRYPAGTRELVGLPVEVGTFWARVARWEAARSRGLQAA